MIGSHRPASKRSRRGEPDGAPSDSSERVPRIATRWLCVRARCFKNNAVQFYDDDGFLTDAVGRFLAAGLKAGDRLVVIAAGQHRIGLLKHLEPCNGQAAVESGQLLMVDARETLAKFMVGDVPDPDLFHHAHSRLLATVRETGGGRIRAFGEMVDLLWRDGNSRAAIRLEELWNDAGKQHTFSLLCAYVMNNFYKEGDSLYISARSVASHGGKIEVRSSSENGTEFAVRLPVS